MSLATFFSDLWQRIKSGGGLITSSPFGAATFIPATGSLIGNTAKNVLSPLLPILAVLVFVYAFGSNR